MRAELVTDAAELGAHEEAWRSLAETLQLPYATPDWMLGWWRHAAPPGARLRVALAHDDTRLVAIAPCFSVRERGVEHLKLLAAPISHRTQPLCEPGRELDAGVALAEALGGARPRPGVVALEGLPAGSPWPEVLAGSWPAPFGTGLRRRRSEIAPTLPLEGADAESWFAARSRNFRSQIRRARRDLGERGATTRVATSEEEVTQDVDAFIRLHHARWDWRGGSGAITPPVERMLREDALELTRRGYLRLAAVATADATVAVQAIVAAGGEASYWLGGFDEDWAATKPALVALVAAVEDSFARGDARFDLGAGDYDYKLRFTDERETLEWSAITPRSPRTPLDWALLAPWRLRSALGSATYDRRMALRRRLRRSA